jgi:ribosomal-protein-alanine N-acetyltransferase
MEWLAPDGAWTVEGRGVRLRPPRRTDYEEWSALRERSRAFLQPWEPTWPVDDLTRPAFRRRLAAYARERAEGIAYRFLVFRTQDGALTGGLSLSNIRRGVAQTATLGYWAGEGFAGQGYTTAAVEAAVRFAFERLGLHRVEAACVPENARSARVLEKCGFEPEGRARAYLQINGRWRDHSLFGIVRPESRAGGPA